MYDEKKLNLILDIDETLVSANKIEDIITSPPSYPKLKKFNYTIMNDKYIIFERPHLREFLDFAFNNFNVSVWTAGTQSYGKFVIDNILLKNSNNRNLDFFLHSLDVDISGRKYGGIKNLNYVYNDVRKNIYFAHNTLIVDDLILVKQTNMLNCLFIDKFSFLSKGSEDDGSLIHLMNFLKNTIITK